MRLISDGVVDRDGVPGLAARVGYTERHLNRLLIAEVGASPLAIARAARAHTARVLVETTSMGFAEIAFAAGFGSVRQFNDTIRESFGRTPSELRAARAGRRPIGAVTDPGPGSIELRLPYRAPLHAASLLGFLASRTIEGVDEVIDDRYRRGLRLPHGPGWVELAIRPGYVQANLRLADMRDVAPAVARCRRLLDLDADPVAIDAVLARDPALVETVAKEPGVRVPGAVDSFEIAVRAIVGQQISVSGARSVLSRLVAACATSTIEPDEVPGATARSGMFPAPEEVAMAPDEAFGMPAARRQTIRALATAIAEGTLRLDPGADRNEAAARLVAIAGIGPWTAQYVALRALGDPDVLMVSDLGVRRGARALDLPVDPLALQHHAQQHWAPWRSYATIRLWRHA
jgi:AraC family transcriptional regulator of adaptative response / DNA-3-methyladenine glycosylase II